MIRLNIRLLFFVQYWGVILLLGLTIVPSILATQSSISDSLNMALSSTQNPEERCQILLQLSTSYMRTEPAAALEYAEKAIAITGEFQLIKQAGLALRQCAKVRQQTGDYDGALNDYSDALANAHALGDSSLISEAMNDLGVVEQRRGNFSAADEWLHASLHIARTRKDTSAMAAALTNLASSANHKGDINQTILYLDTVLVLDSLQGSWGYFSQGLGNISMMYLRQNLTDKALAYALRGQRAAELAGNIRGRYQNAMMISQAYMNLLDYGPALAFGHSALSHARSSGRSDDIGQAYLLLQALHQKQELADSVAFYFNAGEEYITPAKQSSRYNNYGSFHKNSLGDTVTAKFWYEKALSAAIELNDGPSSFLPLVNLAVVAAAEQNWPSARTYLSRAEQYSEMDVDLGPSTLTTIGRIHLNSGEPQTAANYFLRVLNAQREMLVHNDSTRTLAATYEREISDLRQAQQAERLVASAQKVANRNSALVGGTLLLLLLCVATWLALRRGKKLKLANQQLETLREEVHHRVRNDFQSVASMFFLQLNELKDAPLQKTLKGIYDRIRDLSQIHELLQENHGAHFDFSDYLRNLATKRLTALPVTKAVKLDYYYNLTPEVAERLGELEIRQLAIILNELITNAGKYAFLDHPSPVLTLRVNGAPGEPIAFSLTDNGNNKMPELGSNSTSFGLRMISRTCESLGWSLITDHTAAGHSYLIQTNIIV